jgi:hypothetical protein
MALRSHTTRTVLAIAALDLVPSLPQPQAVRLAALVKRFELESSGAT